MSDFSRIFRGFTSGALGAGGVSGFNPWVMLGGGLLGGATGAWGGQDYDSIRTNRYKAALEKLNAVETSSLRRIGAETDEMRRGARSQGRDLARSLGRKEATGAFSRPAEGAVSRNRLSTLRGTQERAADRRFALEMDFANRPIEADTPLDVLETIAGPALQYGLGKMMLDGQGDTSSGSGGLRSMFGLEIPSVSDREVGELSRFRLGSRQTPGLF